jgi:hypothetical protein
MAALAVAESTAQCADLNLQICLFDERFRPGSGYQLLLADRFASPLDECGKNVKGSAAEPHRLVALEQEPLRRKQPKRAKRDRVCVHGPAPWSNHFTCFYLNWVSGRSSRALR